MVLKLIFLALRTIQFNSTFNALNFCSRVSSFSFQVKSGSIFDNVIVTDSVTEAEEFGKETFEKTKEGEKKMKDEQDEKERKEREEEEKKKKEEDDAKKDEDEEEEEEEEEEVRLRMTTLNLLITFTQVTKTFKAHRKLLCKRNVKYAVG